MAYVRKNKKGDTRGRPRQITDPIRISVSLSRDEYSALVKHVQMNGLGSVSETARKFIVAVIYR